MKTSGVASTTATESGISSARAAVACTTNEDNKDVPEPPIIRWKVAEIAEIRRLMWQLHRRMPAWKLKAYTEALQVRPIDLAALAETTGVQFASAELVEVAIKCLDEITKEMARDTGSTSSADAAAPSQSDKQMKEDEPDPLDRDKSRTAESSADKKDEILIPTLQMHVPQHKM